MLGKRGPLHRSARRGSVHLGRLPRGARAGRARPVLRCGTRGSHHHGHWHLPGVVMLNTAASAATANTKTAAGSSSSAHVASAAPRSSNGHTFHHTHTTINVRRVVDPENLQACPSLRPLVC